MDAILLAAQMVLQPDVLVTIVLAALFGLGFAMQLQRAQAHGTGGIARYTRRLLVKVPRKRLRWLTAFISSRTRVLRSRNR